MQTRSTARRHRRFGMGGWLAPTIVGLVVLTAGAALGIWAVEAQRSVEALSRSLVTRTTGDVRLRLEALLRPVERELAMARGWVEDGAMALGEPASVDRLWRPLLAGSPAVSSAIFADGEGREHMLLERERGWHRRRTLPEAGEVRLAELDARGAVTAEQARPLDYDPRSRPWHQGAVAALGSLHWTEPYVFRTTRDLGVTASIGWRVAGDGGGLRVLALDVKLGDLARFLRDLPLGHRGAAAVISGDGRLLGRSSHADGGVDPQLLEPVADVGSPALRAAFAAWDAAGRPAATALSFPHEGGTWWVGAAPVQDVGGGRLAVLTLLSEADLLGDFTRQRNRLLGVAAVALALALLAALGLDRLMLRRLDTAVDEARRVGRYALLRRLGAGAMGEVYLAQHAMLRRPTAVKLMSPAVAGQPGALERFEREVQRTAELTSPHTIAIYDYGRTEDGTFYYAMEYLDGLDLEDAVERFGPMPAGRVVHLIAQVCESLEEAHGSGLVHRDIKPSNLYLCRRGARHDVVKVLDFGLVKDVIGGASTDLTQDVVTGTPTYLSPESIERPEAVGPASDLYALGGVAFFLLTGETVFEGQTLMHLAYQHLNEAPRAASAVAGPPAAALDAVVAWCLAKEPSERPPSAAALREALRRTEVAGTWTEADAAEWWRVHGDRIRPPDASAGDVRLEVDLGSRLR